MYFHGDGSTCKVCSNSETTSVLKHQNFQSPTTSNANVDDKYTFSDGFTLIVPGTNSVSPLKIAVANRLIHAIHKNCIVYLFL